MNTSMTIYSSYTAMRFPTMEEIITILFVANIIMSCISMRVKVVTINCDSSKDYDELLKKYNDNDEQHVDDYNKLLAEFTENDEKHVEDYNDLVDENTDLQTRISELEDQLEIKNERVRTFKKRINRLESRIARNTASYAE